ncbi:MAG: S-layer homology domain-containing protein, partial [Selenomonadaceae bacterium]
MKKALSTMVAFALAAGISGTVMAADSAGSFSDIPKDHWSYAAVDQLVKDGIIEGY